MLKPIRAVVITLLINELLLLVTRSLNDPTTMLLDISDQMNDPSNTTEIPHCIPLSPIYMRISKWKTAITMMMTMLQPIPQHHQTLDQFQTHLKLATQSLA